MPNRFYDLPDEIIEKIYRELFKGMIKEGVKPWRGRGRVYRRTIPQTIWYDVPHGVPMRRWMVRCHATRVEWTNRPPHLPIDEFLDAFYFGHACYRFSGDRRDTNSIQRPHSQRYCWFYPDKDGGKNGLIEMCEDNGIEVKKTWNRLKMVKTLMKLR